jgi:hypothetical protein
MNVMPMALNNAVNLTMCMVNVSAKLITDSDNAIQYVVISKLQCVGTNILL